LSLVVGLLAVLPPARAEMPAALAGLEAIHPAIDTLYIDLHRNPELSLQEEKTAAKLAARLRELGYEVTERVGGHGVVGVLRNGTGPVVMIRTDLDALPIREATGLPYASTVEARNPAGDTVPVMHACGHDVHMASWVGAAAMIDDGLLTRVLRAGTAALTLSALELLGPGAPANEALRSE
jgi:hippurate hydrolase